MNTFLRLFSNILLLGRIRYSLSQDACQKMSKPTTSPDYQPLIISVSKNREWGKMGNEWGKNPQKKMGIPFQITFIFPQKTVLFHPEFRISLLLQIHSQPYKRAWLPQKKAQKLEKWNRYSPQKHSFLEDTFLFQVIRKVDDYVNNLIMSLLEEKKAFPFQLFQLFFQHIPPTPIFIYIYIYHIYN